MAHPLSRKQMEVLKALQTFAERHGYIPSVRELAGRLRKSSTTVYQHLKMLEQKGYLRSDGTAHGWVLTRSGVAAAQAYTPGRPGIPRGGPLEDGWVQVPIAGVIAAGLPLEAVEDVAESIPMPRALVPEGAFALRVRGNSMVDDHILDGDLVIVRPQRVVRDGEVVVALLEDGTATLKRVYRERNRVRLQPANAAMKPIYTRNVRIQGRVVGIWRSH